MRVRCDGDRRSRADRQDDPRRAGRDQILLLAVLAILIATLAELGWDRAGPAAATARIELGAAPPYLA